MANSIIQKEKLFKLTMMILQIIGVPTNIFGFDIKKILWQKIIDLNDKQLIQIVSILKEYS